MDVPHKSDLLEGLSLSSSFPVEEKIQQQKPKPTTTLSVPSFSKELIRNKEIVLNLDMLIPRRLWEIG